MRVGYQTLTWANYYKDYGVREAIRNIGEAGFKGIEFMEPIPKLGRPEHIQSALDEAGIEAASISCGLNMDPEDRSDISETKKRAEFAGALGVKDVMLCGGWLSESVNKEDGAYRMLADKLDACCEYASGLNMNIAFHPHKDTIVETREDISRLLRFTNKIKLCLDIAHLAACGSDPSETIKAFKDITTYIHLKDWDAAKNDFVELGRGQVDISGCLSALENIGYDGWAVVELDRTGSTPEESAAINADYLRKAGLI